MSAVVDSDYDYASSYHWFFEALVSLASEPLEQCRRLQFDNVAWFLKEDFLSRSEILLSQNERRLSAEQLTNLGILLSLVGSLPPLITHQPDLSLSGQESSVNDERWIPIRQAAQTLIALLEDETRRVNLILHGD